MIPTHIIELLSIEAQIAVRNRILEAVEFGKSAAHYLEMVNASTTIQSVRTGLAEDFEQIRKELAVQPTEERKLS